ncbi:hypothetical protein CEXT_581921 [Caerostris extrusa]|uniref:Uncharacterized protein n=1 Tax=Caerostris extrusa TaxID=172846 RepID=A0AAV4R6K6_CAEEX|nr:hypothetical protein CEXT_581921 [Caerostris extrusa]
MGHPPQGHAHPVTRSQWAITDCRVTSPAQVSLFGKDSLRERWNRDVRERERERRWDSVLEGGFIQFL